MPATTDQLIAWRLDPANAGLSNAQLSAKYGPVKTPRGEYVVWATLYAPYCLGMTRGLQVYAALAAASAGTGDLAIMAQAIRDMLGSTGLNPQDAQFPAVAAELVAASLVTSDDVDKVQYVTTDPYGSPSEADFAGVEDAASALAARLAAITVLRDANNARYNGNADKLAYLDANPAAQLPADLAALDAFAIPTGGGN